MVSHTKEIVKEKAEIHKILESVMSSFDEEKSGYPNVTTLTELLDLSK